MGGQQGGSSGSGNMGSVSNNAMQNYYSYMNQFGAKPTPTVDPGVTIPVGGPPQAQTEQDYFSVLMDDLYQRMAARTGNDAAEDIGWADSDTPSM